MDWGSIFSAIASAVASYETGGQGSSTAVSSPGETTQAGSGIWGGLISAVPGLLGAVPGVLGAVNKNQETGYQHQKDEAEFQLKQRQVADQEEQFKMAQEAAASKFKAEMHKQALQQLLEAEQTVASNSRNAYATRINQFNNLGEVASTAAARAIRR